MSTKTTIKRIALVAAVAAAFGGLSTVAANANTVTGSAAESYAFTGSGYANSGSSVTQVVGVPATVTLSIVNEDSSTNASSSATITSSGVGSIAAVTAVTAGVGSGVGAATGLPGAGAGSTVTYPTSQLQFFGDGANGAQDTSTVTLSVFSNTAGTQTVSAAIINAVGIEIGTATGTVTWTATAGAIGLAATNAISGFVAGSSNSACTAESTIGAANAFFTANAISSQYYGTSSTAQYCSYYFDANGNPVTPTGVTFYGAGGTFSNTATISSNEAGVTVTGDGQNKGLVSYTTYAKDAYGNSITTTKSFTWYGKVASITLSNDVYADNATTTHPLGRQPYDDTSGSTSVTGIHSLAITLKDASGNVIPFSNWGSVTNDVSAANTWILSDNGNGNTSTKKGQSNAYASLTLGENNDHGASSKNNGGFTVACSTTKQEHLKITAYAYDSATGLDDFASNTVDFYCSGAPATVTVTPSATSANAGQVVAVDASATDANGYPVYDGYPLVLGASNGGVFLGSSTGTTTNGSITGGAAVGNNPLQLIVGSQGDNVVTVAATNAAGASISASSTIAVAGGVNAAANAGTDAANEATDAANAATDAANAAADAADAATTAAQDAGAKADAALAAVTALSAKITVLAAQIAKIVKKLGA